MGIGKSSGSSSIKDKTTGETAEIRTDLQGRKALVTISEVQSVNLQTGSTTPVIPAENIVYIKQALLRGGSNSLLVNGSLGNPLDFIYQPPSGQVHWVEGITLFIYDFGTNDFDEYGARSALPNGTQIILKKNSIEYVLTTIKDNVDIVNSFSDQSYTPPGGAGFLDDDEPYSGALKLQIPIKLNGSTSDQIIARVRDDLRSLESHRVYVKVWRSL